MRCATARTAAGAARRAPARRRPAARSAPGARLPATAAAPKTRPCGASPTCEPLRAGTWMSRHPGLWLSRRGVGHEDVAHQRRHPGGTRPSRRQETEMIRRFRGPRTLVAVSAVAVLAAGVAACSSSTSSGSSSSSSSPTLTMESSPESTITQAFNPFIPTQAAWGMGATGLIYEPLLQFDIAAPPKYYPWLATAYRWSDGGKAVTFTLRPGVKFNNGTPMTAADVVFTYNLVKKNPSINLGGLPISSVSASGNTVTLTFPSAEYTNLQEIAGVPILPQAIWSKAGNPATYADPNPVGTGPYKLKTFTPQGFTLTKYTGYWQAPKAKVTNVYFPVYTSNTGALSALFSGQIDWTGNFIPGLQQNFVSKAPAYHHFWEAPGSTNALMPNLNKWPTNQLPVRQAISAAINRNLLASEGEAGLENPVLTASGLTLPTFQNWAGSGGT